MDYVATEVDGRVAVVTIANPPMNPLSAPLLEELLGEVERLDSDESVGAIVLRGGGDRAFVAGADIKEFPALRESIAQSADGTPSRLVAVGLRLESARKPSIAAIQGFCLGGGLELAMACDVRVCSEDAQLGQPEIKLGLIPGAGGTQRLPRLVGRGRAMLMNLSGEFVDARTAYEWGLVERVVPREELVETALGIGRSFAAQSPHAVAVLKELARESRDLPLDEGLRREAVAFARCLASEDGLEGVTAFIEKRQPSFTGR